MRRSGPPGCWSGQTRRCTRPSRTRAVSGWKTKYPLGKLRRLQNICSRLYLVRGAPEIKKPSSQKDGSKTFVRFLLTFPGWYDIITASKKVAAYESGNSHTPMQVSVPPHIIAKRLHYGCIIPSFILKNQDGGSGYIPGKWSCKGAVLG